MRNMQEITIPKQPTLADKIVEFPMGTVICVVPRADAPDADRPWDFIHRTGLNGWVAGRGATRKAGYLDQDDIRQVIEEYIHREYRFFLLHTVSEGWYL